MRWLDGDGVPVDLSAYTSWRLDLVNDDNVAHLRKTAGIVGADGTAAANVLVAWSANELAAVPAGLYRVRLSGVAADGRRRYFPGPAPTVRIVAVATTPP